MKMRLQASKAVVPCTFASKHELIFQKVNQFQLLDFHIIHAVKLCVSGYNLSKH